MTHAAIDMFTNKFPHLALGDRRDSVSCEQVNLGWLAVSLSVRQSSQSIDQSVQSFKQSVQSVSPVSHAVSSFSLSGQSVS